jgi:dTDP-4-amino-4,6-dideoxygalactose transaminase
MGSSQLKKLDQFIQKRRKIANIYDKSFSIVDSLKIPKAHNSVSHAYHLYPLQINFDDLALTKPKFFQRMKDIGVNLQVHYIPVHLQPFYKNNYGFQPGDFPVSERFYRNEVSLPIYPDLSRKEVTFVVNNILEIIST